MVRNYGRFKRLALSGIASAALGASLILPATALAYSPDSLSVGLAGNYQTSDQGAFNGSGQLQFTKSYQDASQNAAAISPVVNVAKPEVKSVAVNDVQGGDVRVSGNDPHVYVGNFQISDASANGDAKAINDTGNANTGSVAASLGGSSDQSNKQSADGNGQSGDAKSKTDGNVSIPVSGQISGDATGYSLSASGILSLFGWGSQGGSSSATSLGLANSGNSGKNSSSAPNSSTATTGDATGSGTNSGANTNQANTSGGAATSVAYGGNTGLNTANAIVAGGIAGNSLTVGVDASGNTSGSSGAVTNTGSVSSSAGAAVTQSGTPLTTVTQTNDATQVTKAEQSNPQIAAALSNQHAASTTSNTDTSTVTVTTPST